MKKRYIPGDLSQVNKEVSFRDYSCCKECYSFNEFSAQLFVCTNHNCECHEEQRKQTK